MAQERALLEQAGHTVLLYQRSNAQLDHLSLAQRLALPARLIWARDVVRELTALIQRERPDVAHVHNTFALLSPAVYYVCQRLGVPVVQTLHNYRLACVRADFFRAGQVCHTCLGKTLAWPGIVHGCYRDSRLLSAGVATMQAVHRGLRTWTTQVDRYIALTAFARQQYLQAGLPAERLVLKSNFVAPDPGVRPGRGDYALFVGRCVPEKKLHTLFAAWQHIRDLPLRLVGGGLTAEAVQQMVQHYRLDNVTFLGPRPRQEVFTHLHQARMLIFPSEWYETFGMVLIEAFACGVPVIASRLGASTDVVTEHQTGLFFQPGDAADLAAQVRWALTHPEAWADMGQQARRAYETHYTATANYQLLMDIYTQAMQSAQRRRLAHGGRV